MSTLSVLTLPDTRLKTVAQAVERFDSELKELAADMLETMYAAPGIGLAATQVNRHIQLVVIDVSEENNQPLIMVNPKITSEQGLQTHEEGCLSIPGIYAKVKRANEITVSYQDLEGNDHQLQATGLMAVCIQHELDHLQGIVFLDHLSVLKRKIALKKLNKS